MRTLTAMRSFGTKEWDGAGYDAMSEYWSSKLQDFQPGDGTRYEMHLSTLPPGHNIIGCSQNGFAVLAILNMGTSIAVPIDGHLMFTDFKHTKGWANPWTIRAALLFLKREAESRGWPMTVTLEGCPVGD